MILSNPAIEEIWGKVIRSGDERYAAARGTWYDTGRAVQPDEWASVHALRDGASLNQVIAIDTFDGLRKVIRNVAAPIRNTSGGIIGAVIVNDDISAQTTAERERNDALKDLGSLTTRLVHAQDDERRRIAQLLHENTAQDLAALKMLLARLRRTTDALSADDRALLDESVLLGDRAMSEVRTLSYLLHPPFLEEAGLSSAIRWYAEGFHQRSGIDVAVDVPDTLERLPRELEAALFRIVQEALINIHRHSGSHSARIDLALSGDQVVLEVIDRGQGMSPKLLAQLRDGSSGAGVGVASMRERLKQLGGTLEIESSAQGTTVRATVPRLTPAA